MSSAVHVYLRATPDQVESAVENLRRDQPSGAFDFDMDNDGFEKFNAVIDTFYPTLEQKDSLTAAALAEAQKVDPEAMTFAQARESLPNSMDI